MSISHPCRAFAQLFLGSSLAILAAVSSAGNDEVANPAGGGGSLVLEPVPSVAKPKRGRVVYACHEPRLVVFSDRPCGEATTLRAVSFAPEPPTGSPPTTVAAAPSAATRPQPKAPPTAVSRAAAETSPASDEDEQCATWRAQLERVDARMRQGYSARESADLWNRWRDLKDRLHEGRCRA